MSPTTSNWRFDMRNMAHRVYGIRYAVVTGIVLAVAAILPLVALAGGGDPTGH